MAEIDITSLVTGDTWGFSGSIATHGPNAARQTWANALGDAKESPLLSDDNGGLDAMRRWAKETGAWDEGEIAAWGDDELNALFIQLVSGDMRECGLDNYDHGDFDWEDYKQRSQAGEINGSIYKGDDDRIYYYLGL